MEDLPERGLHPLGQVSQDRYQSGNWPHALLQRMIHWVEQSPRSSSMLDLGCGEGALLEAIGSLGVGVDLNAKRLAYAAFKTPKVLLADGAYLPFGDTSFDIVVCMEVLEHVPSMEALIREVRRVLVPGGRWIISVPSVTLRSWYEMWRYRRAYYCDVNEHYREFSAVNIPWFQHRFFPMSLFKSRLQKYGFSFYKQDGVRYLFPRWISRFPNLQKTLESPSADRCWSKIPWIRNFPFWTILVLWKSF